MHIRPTGYPQVTIFILNQPCDATNMDILFYLHLHITLRQPHHMRGLTQIHPDSGFMKRPDDDIDFTHTTAGKLIL